MKLVSSFLDVLGKLPDAYKGAVLVGPFVAGSAAWLSELPVWGITAITSGSVIVAVGVVIWLVRRRKVPSTAAARSGRIGIDSEDSVVDVGQLNTAGLDTAVKARRSLINLGKGEFK